MSRSTIEITRTVRALTLDPVTTIDERKFPALMITLKRYEALRRAADSASTMVDGYPTKTPMASEPTAMHRPARTTGDDAEPDDEGPDTTTERAAVAHLIGRGWARDEIRDAAWEAEQSLKAIAHNLEKLGQTLDRVDVLRSTTPELMPYCHVAKLLGLPYDPVWSVVVNTTFKGYLTEPWKVKHGVSRWVYDQVRKNRRLPTEAEMRTRLALEVAMTEAVPTMPKLPKSEPFKPIDGHDLTVTAGGNPDDGFMARVTCTCGWVGQQQDAHSPIETHVVLALAIPHLAKVRADQAEAVTA